MKKIGIVGLGIMGRGIAANFLKNGYTVFVWNRTTSVSKEFSKNGAIVCLKPKEVAQKADIVFEITANDESSREVWVGNEGILSGAKPNTILVAAATLSVSWVDELIQKCKKQGFTFLDMAMTGGRIGAESGKLILLCGGEKSVFEALQPTLRAITIKTLYFGQAGQGMRYKLILNFLQAVHIIGFGQAMKIAKAYKMDTKKVGDALAEKPGGIMTAMAWRDYQKEPNPINFSIEWITKDLIYAKQMAKDLNVGLLDEVLLEYKKAAAKGFSKKDWASINTLI